MRRRKRLEHDAVAGDGVMAHPVACELGGSAGVVLVVIGAVVLVLIALFVWWLVVRLRADLDPTPNRTIGSQVQRGKNHLWYREPDDTTDTHLVFVHGIFSSSETAWTHWGANPSEDAYWPQIVREDPELGKCAIYLAGYDTRLDSGSFSVKDAAESLHTRLLQTPRGGHAKPLDCPRIVFVMHSTGGLVVRELLVRYGEDFRGRKVGLQMVASPSLGSDYADWLLRLSRAYNNKMAQQLAKSDPYLAGLDDRFRNAVEKNTQERGYCLKVMDLIETKFIGSSWLNPIFPQVVPESAAGKYSGNAHRIANTNHFTIAAPADSDSDSHVWLKNFLSEFAKLECPMVPPQPRIRVIAAAKTSAGDWNLKLDLGARELPKTFRIRLELSDDGHEWNSGKEDPDNYEILDYQQWAAASSKDEATGGYAFGKIRGTAKFVRSAVFAGDGSTAVIYSRPVAFK
jgi:pimeloyl-ACP methyl ester carboxylesterase